ncbi:MAG: hypothetical protein IPJ16_05745 [Bacteroidales bacterium]|nr:hypothetical protein [Bacteroidales bacterium]
MRTFLQFKAKVNGGIRETIKNTLTCFWPIIMESQQLQLC